VAKPVRRGPVVATPPRHPHCLPHGEKLSLYIQHPKMKTVGRCPKGCEGVREWRAR